MSLRRGLVTTAALIIAAACTSAPPSSPASSPASSATPSATATPSAPATPSGAASPTPGSPLATSPAPSASGSPAAGTAPEFEEAPLWVRNREPLPFCGLEIQPDTLNLDARRCFIEAAAAGRPAEMVVRMTTVEGGTVHQLYRTTPGNPFEQVIDWTGDPFGPGGWERQVCIQITRGDPVPGDPLGELNFGFDSCEDATPSL